MNVSSSTRSHALEVENHGKNCKRAFKICQFWGCVFVEWQIGKQACEIIPMQ
jgi:hypothetical protein